MSSLVTTNFVLVSNANQLLLVAWSPVQSDFNVYRILFNSLAPEAKVSLEHRYSGSSAFDRMLEVLSYKKFAVARNSGDQKFMFVLYGLSSAQVLAPIATYFRENPIGDVVAPLAIASSAYKSTLFFIDFLPGSSSGILRSVDSKISSNVLPVNVVARVTAVSSPTAVMKWNVDNVFAFVGKMITPMKTTSCIMTSVGGITVTGVAFSHNERSVLCTISNWNFMAGDYSFEFPGMIVVNSLLVAVFPVVSEVSVPVFDVEPYPFKKFGLGFRSSSTQSVTFVSVGNFGNYSCSLAYVSATEYRCASPPLSMASGTHSLMVTLHFLPFSTLFLLVEQSKILSL